MPTTSRLALPYPTLADASDVPADIQALADKIAHATTGVVGLDTDDAITGVKTFNKAPRHAVQALAATASIVAGAGRLVTFTGAAGQILTLPTAAAGMEFVVVNIGATNAVSVARAGSDTIDGAATSIVVPAGRTMTFRCGAAGAWATERRTMLVPHTFAIGGPIAVPSGDSDYIPPFFVKLPAGQTARLVSARHRINGGTSVTAKLQKNGADITGFTGMSVTPTAADTAPTAVDLADNDLIALVVTAVSGTPKNMTVTLFVEYKGV